MFKIRVTVTNPNDKDLFFEDDFWVDTGAMYTFIPEEYLEKIRIDPTSTRNLILADGRTDKRLFGYSNLKIAGIEEVNSCPVIFAPKGSLFLLGATALENFGLNVDPENKKLVPVSAIIGGFLASS